MVVPTLEVRRSELSGSASSRSTGAQSIPLQHSRGYQSCATAAWTISIIAMTPTIAASLVYLEGILVPSSPAPCEEVALGALEPGGADGVARATAMMSCSVSAPCACAHLRRSRVGPHTMAYEFDGGDGGGEGFAQLPPFRYGGVGSDAVMGMGREVD
jgi:hypothetical protein